MASRISPGGVEEADKIAQPLLDALTKPLTAKEKKTGKWAPEQDRILFEGTYHEADKFYNQTEQIPRLLGAPFSVYTDGLPVVIPTEQRVKEMLSGTSHKPDELITLQRDVNMGGEVRLHRLKGDEKEEGRSGAVHAHVPDCNSRAGGGKRRDGRL